jgi:hypothetical protein
LPPISTKATIGNAFNLGIFFFFLILGFGENTLLGKATLPGRRFSIAVA